MNHHDEHPEGAAMDGKIIEVLDRLADRLHDQEQPSGLLSIEKIVAAVIMLLVTGVCLWVGSSLTTMTQKVIELQANVSHQSQTVAELKAEVRDLRTGALSTSTNNTQNIQLILERMKADDAREIRDDETIAEIRRQIQALQEQVRGNKP